MALPEAGETLLGEVESFEVQASPIQDAVQDYLCQVIESGQPISALAWRAEQRLPWDEETWLYQVIGGYEALPDEQKDYFELLTRWRGPPGVHRQLHRAGSGAVSVRLGRSHANAVHRLLRNQLLEVSCSAIWNDIHRAFELGRIESGRLKFSPHERELLREEAKRQFGWNLIEPLPAEDRIQAAAQAIDEKLAPQRPDDGFVLAKGMLPSPLPALPAGCALRVALQQLDVASIASVLVIENLDCFDQIHRFAAARRIACVADAVPGPRRRHARYPAVAATIARCRPGCRVSGLSTRPAWRSPQRCRTPAMYWYRGLTPELLTKGSREHFHKQHLQARHLDSCELGAWQTVWTEMKQAGCQHQAAAHAGLRRPVALRRTLTLGMVARAAP